ncbi:conserved hypothetical protein [Theileria orientalis strain Shintoku]|uniref:Uncharacterized protein n=1 Tax=Theileria orientalis strain Shintoku TaxID=869250 RepID=J4CD29_THEOR|nr:conserved hypothetical protein [Theileria orientalis strain Shintoku]BAM40422.1 conserved hypothetical protein [Theileria orientalis strain Shintoku]|eukprot:XP_009690723.1 conserved hypothetical protein [Theileria orientalis strain Shintoku]
MNTGKLVSFLLGAAAAVVLIVVLAVFLHKKGGAKPEESKPAEADSTAAPELPAQGAAAGVLNVVTFMRDSSVEDMRNLTGSYLLDARAKTNYQSVGQTVTVVTSDLEDAPGYTKLTHTLPSPFKGTEVVFDAVSRLPTFEHPVATLAAYWWQNTLLFLTFKTVNQTGQPAVTKFYHFSANRTEVGLRWSRVMVDHTNDLDQAVLAGKLDEVNTLFGNVVTLHLDEFLDESTGTYTSEFGGLPTTFTLNKRPFTQAGFMKVTHKLLEAGSEVAKPFKLKKLLVSGAALTDLVLPKKPLTSVAVYWWHNTPLLAELDLVGGTKDHFVYNLDANNWLNEPVEKVRSTLTLLKNNLGVPLTLDLGKKGAAADVTYTTNEVLVRVSGQAPDSPRGFPKYTHRFATGKSHFVGNFLNSGTPQNGLPFARVNEVSVFFSDEVPLLVQMNMSGSGSLSTKRVFYSNNGFGFWSRVMLTETLKDTEAVLKKLDAENKKLVSTNDKYVVDVVMKSDYLSVGKLLKVAKQDPGTELKAYTMYQHNRKNNEAFKFQKLVAVGKDVTTEGLEELTGVTNAKVYWFLDTPLLVHLTGTTRVLTSNTTPAAPVPNPSQLPTSQAQGAGAGGVVPGVAGVGGGVAGGGAGQPSVPGAPGAVPGVAAGGVPAAPGVGVGGAGVQATAATTLQASSPVAATTTTKAVNHYYSFNGESKKWVKVEYTVVGDGQTNRLKNVLDTAKATLGSVTLQVGHGAGAYRTGPVTVTVTNATSQSKYGGGVFDMMLHTMSAPFPLGKLKHFDFDLNLTHVPLKENESVAPEPPATDRPEVAYPMDFNAVGMEVYVYKYVPLVAALKMEEGNTLFFANTLAESKWRRFAFDNDSKVGEKLEELRKKLTAVSSLDVCKKHEADTAATYTLKPAVGAGTVNVALSKLEGVSDGMKGVLHTLPSAQKLGSLTCGDEVLTGLDCGNVNKVAVYFKGDSPAVVKANSVPKYFTLNPQGGLSRHVLPPDATDLNAQQVTELVATVANKMGSVLEFNMEMRNNYNVASGLQMKVAHLDLGGTWSLYTHTLGDNETFTVSKFMKGSKDVVGLPHNKLLSAVYLGFKGNEPKLLGLKTVSPAAYEWHVFDKYRWLFDFSTETLLEDDEVLAVLEDVDDGLENEFALDLALESTPEVFLFDHVKLADAALTGFARNTYTVADLMYPFLLGALQFNSDVLTATDLATHHLNALTAYTYMDEPVLLHGLTFDKKSVFFETNFAAVFNAVDLGEFNEEALKARLLALKAKAAGLVTVELTAKAGYKNYEKDVLVNEKTDAGLDTFKKYEHKLLETPNTGGASGTKPTAFTFRKVKYNNTLLELVLPEGTVTSVNTFLGSDDVPAGFHFVLTPPPAAAPAQQPSGPVASQPAPAVATAMHHYFFHKAGKWEPMTNATELAVEELKKKLLEAEKTFDRKVTVNLANKVTHEVWNRVENANGQEVADSAAGQGDANTRTRKTLNFLVEASPKEVSRMKAYTHVPQLKTVVGTGNPATSLLAPYVAAFTLGEHKLVGFEMNKVEKFTVFWLDDTYPVMALLKTPSAHKFYRLAREFEWVLAKSVADEPSEQLMFEMATLARNAFTYEASVDVGMDTGLGTAFKYRSGQLTMRVVDAGLLGTNYRVFVHASTSVFAPAFLLDDLNLFGAAGLRSLHALGFVREVKVFANLDRFPLLVEVAATTLKHPRAAPRYHYYKFNQALAPDKTGGAAGSGAPLLFVKTTDVKLPEKELLELLKTLDAVRSTTFVVKLDAKASYNPKEQVTFTVARTTPAAQNGNFEVYDHTFPVTVNAGATAAASHAKKTLVLMVGDKKVGFVTKDGGFTSVTVHWFSGVPVHAALKFGTATKDYLNYFFFGGEHWTTVFDLGVEFALANKQMLYQKLSPHFATKYLDFGNKTLSTQFGVVTDLKLVDYKPEGLKLPDGLVGYTFEWPDAGHQVVKMLNFGWDFDALELELPPGDVKEVHVFSPEGFYAPVFAEVKTNVLVTPATTSPQKAAEYKDVYNYFHVTSSGFWTTLYTKGAKLDNETLALRLAKVAQPALVDLGKREGTYGLPKMLVEKTFFSTAHTYARYEHKLAVGENFLMTRWVFGGLQMEDLPALKADYVAAYFYEDAVPLLLEVNNAGFVRFFAPDANGHWMPENVSRTAVSAFLDNLVHEMTLVASHSEEWVPHLNTKFLRQMELVPQVKVVAVPVPESAKAAAAVVPAPGDASTAPGTPVASPAPEPAAPGAPDAAAAAAAAAKAAGSGAGAVEPQVTPVQAPVVSSAANVQQTSNLQGAGQVASGLGGVGAGAGAGGAGAEPGAATTQAQASNALTTQAQQPSATVTSPAPAKPATDVQLVSRAGGPGSPVRPAAPQVPVANVEAPVNAKREFKPALFNYEDLFHGYLTLGKFVKVARFDTVPNGYNFGKHSFVNGGRYYANKFLLGGKEYALPVEAGASTKSRLASSLAFYSWSTNPLMLKLGLHAKAPVFFSYNKTNDTWAKATVVNLDEELEHLNNLNDVYVFDLAKPNGRHNYYNNRSYYVSDGPEVLPELFKSAEFETFRQVQAKLGENQLEHHEKVPFKLGKLRLNGVDYPSDGLPDDTVFYFMHVFTSKASKKPLLLVFYDDQDERDRKKFEKANPGKFLGHYFQWNLDGTWSRFVPEGADAVVNKLRELEALFAVPLTLDLAKVTGTAGLLNYKANGNDFVVERVFVPAVRAPAEAPARGPAPSDLDVEASALLGGRVGARDVPGPAGSQGGVLDAPEPALRPAVAPGGPAPLPRPGTPGARTPLAGTAAPGAPGAKVVLEDPVVQTRVTLGTGDTVGPAAPAAPQPARAGAAAQSGQSVAGQAGFTLVTRGVTPLSQPGAPTPPVAGPGPHPGEGRVAGLGPQPVHQGGVPDTTNPASIRGGAEVSGNGNGGTQNQNNGQSTTVGQGTTSTTSTVTTVNSGSSGSSGAAGAGVPGVGVPGVGVPGVGVPGTAGNLNQAGSQSTQQVVTGQPTQPVNTVTATSPTGEVTTTVQSGGQTLPAAKAAVTPGPTTATGVPAPAVATQGAGAAAQVGGAGAAAKAGVGAAGTAQTGVAAASNVASTGVPGAGGVAAAGQPGGPQAGAAAGLGPAEPQQPAKPVVAEGSQLNVLPEVTTLPAGVAFVDVAFVAHSGPVPPTEENAGFELYHHHAPFFVHSFTEQGKTEVKKVAKAKKFNVKKLMYGGVDLDFAAPFEPAVGGYAGMTVFYEKNVKTPFAFALFTLKNEADAEKVHYDVWVHRDLKWVKTEELDAFYNLMRGLEMKNNLGPMEDLLAKFTEKLAELAAAAKAMLPNVFSLDLKQDDTVKFGSVVVDKDADLVDGLDMLKQEFKPRMLSPPVGWVDFSLDSVALHGNRYVGLKLPLVGVHAVYTYFRNSPDRYARFPAVMEMVQKLKGYNKPVFKHWYYVYAGANEWRLHFHTFDKLDDHDVFDMLNARLYEYHRVSEFHKGALMLDLDTKFSHVSMGRFVDAVEFFHDPASTNSPVPEGFLLYRHAMATENSTFTLPFVKLQGEVRETGFKYPFAQYFLYFKEGHVVPMVVVLAQKDNVTDQPTHHWYFVNGHELVKFKFAGAADVDPDNHANKAVVTAKFKELLLGAPEPLKEADALKADPPANTVMPAFPASDPTVFSKAVNGVDPAAVPRSGASPQARGAVDARPDVLNLADGLPSAAGTETRTDSQRSDTGSDTRTTGDAQTSEQRNTQQSGTRQQTPAPQDTAKYDFGYQSGHSWI